MKIEHFLKEDYSPPSTFRKDENAFERVIAILFQMVEALGELKYNPHKKLNLTKFASYLNLSPPQLDHIITLIMKFQELFTSTLSDHQIKPLILQNTQYFLTEGKSKITAPSKTVSISPTERQLFNDYIYLFRQVKKGQGVSLQSSSPFVLNLKQFSTKHPYLFLKNGDHLLYPSELGLKLGEILQSHLKGDKEVERIEIEPYHFVFEG